MKKFPYRQIHLDFHTSPLIDNIAEAFNADDFAKTLVEANVDAINLFAKCHHGFFYYDTQVGMKHPNLNTDLLSRQIEACEKNGIRANVYLSVGIDEYQANLHPEWKLITPLGYNTMGEIMGWGESKSNPLYDEKKSVSYFNSIAFWQFLCVNQPGYREQLRNEVKEIMTKFDPPGLWLDIFNQAHCACDECKKSMGLIGLDPTNYAHVMQHGRKVEIEFFKEIHDLAISFNPNVDIYFNGFSQKMDLVDIPALSVKRKIESNTVFDIESLPSILWPYNHYPLAVQYFNKRSFEKPVTMMSGKFHRIWGDFGTLKNRAAMEYECFRALTYGSRVCLGDQLLPTGEIDKTVYKRIGKVFESIKEKEKWCESTEKVAEIGVFLTNGVLSGASKSLEGALRILTELAYQFDFIDLEDDILKYKLIILPDTVRINEKLGERIEEFIKSGGKVLLSNLSGLKINKDEFALDQFGIEYLGKSEFTTRYIHIDQEINDEGPMDYVIYESGQNVCVKGNTKQVFNISAPYFNRTKEHFCSHFQTPPSHVTDIPAITLNEYVAYIADPLFLNYEEYGNKIYKELIHYCIERLLPKPILITKIPTTAIVTLRENKQSYLLQCLNYIIQKKCREMEIIEEAFPLYNHEFSIKTDKKIKQIMTVPEMKKINFVQNEDYVKFKVPEINGHQMVEIQF